MSKTYYVYLLSNKKSTVIYTGMTNDLVRRVYQHKQGQSESFTQRYRVNRLMYFESFADVRDALEREKQLKAGSRQKKLDLINSTNPEWRDLYGELL